MAASAAEFLSPWSMPASPTAPGRATGGCASSGGRSSHASAACWPRARPTPSACSRSAAVRNRVTVAGNLKFDVRAAQEADATRLLKSIAGGLRLIVAGSTLEGEESALLEAWPRLLAADPQLGMVLAPRHPERFIAVAALLEKSGNLVAQALRLEDARPAQPLRPGEIVLLDTIGELASVYSLASVAFVGGSLVPAGGHNPLEPAQFGVPIVMGPHYANFRRHHGRSARRTTPCASPPEEELAATLIDLLGDRPAAEAMGARAKEVFDRQAGATDRCVAALRELLRAQIQRGAHAMTQLPPRARWLWPLVPPTGSGSLCASSNCAQASSPSAACAGRSSASAISLPADRERRHSPSPWPKRSRRAACTWTCSRAATAGGAPRSHSWSIPTGQQRTSATSRCSSRAKPASRSMLLPSAIRPVCWPRKQVSEPASAEQVRVRVHLLDDGFQHRQLARDIDILLLSRRDLADHLLPAGNLREALRAAERAARDRDTRRRTRSGRGDQIPRLAGTGLASAPPYGNPAHRRPCRRFLRHRAAGAVLSRDLNPPACASRPASPFPTTTATPARDLDRLATAARKAGATALVTTEKDRVRLGALAASLSASLPLRTARPAHRDRRRGCGHRLADSRTLPSAKRTKPNAAH